MNRHNLWEWFEWFNDLEKSMISTFYGSNGIKKDHGVIVPWSCLIVNGFYSSSLCSSRYLRRANSMTFVFVRPVLSQKSSNSLRLRHICPRFPDRACNWRYCCRLRRFRRWWYPSEVPPFLVRKGKYIIWRVPKKGRAGISCVQLAGCPLDIWGSQE